VNKGPGNLDEPTEELVARSAALGEPQILEDFMRLKKVLPVEAIEKPKIARVQLAPGRCV